MWYNFLEYSIGYRYSILTKSTLLEQIGNKKNRGGTVEGSKQLNNLLIQSLLISCRALFLIIISIISK